MMQLLEQGQFFVASSVRFVDSFATPRSQYWFGIYDFQLKIENLESHRVIGKGIAGSRQEDVFEGARSQCWIRNNKFPAKRQSFLNHTKCPQALRDRIREPATGASVRELNLSLR